MRGIAIVAGLVCALAGPVAAQMHGHGTGHGHGAGGHDEMRMPGLQGANATQAESDDLRLIFRKFTTLSREVEMLPDGIRTVTRSSAPEVMEALTRHVVEMIDRVERKDDPKIIIQSPTLDIFFQRAEALTNEIDIAESGIIVVQTSTDPEVVAALQRHAEEVSDMTARGMQAVHERMMAGD